MSIFIELNELGLIKADCVCRISAIDQSGGYFVYMTNGESFLVEDDNYPRSRMVQVLTSIGASVR